MGMENSAGNSSYQINAAVVEEMVLQTSGISAEINADGPVMNIIPKEGRQHLQRSSAAGLFTNHKLESDNLNDELRARGSARRRTRPIKIFDEAAEPGRADQAGQALVLRRVAHLGHGAGSSPASTGTRRRTRF